MSFNLLSTAQQQEVGKILKRTPISERTPDLLKSLTTRMLSRGGLPSVPGGNVNTNTNTNTVNPTFSNVFQPSISGGGGGGGSSSIGDISVRPVINFNQPDPGYTGYTISPEDEAVSRLQGLIRGGDRQATELLDEFRRGFTEGDAGGSRQGWLGRVQDFVGGLFESGAGGGGGGRDSRGWGSQQSTGWQPAMDAARQHLGQLDQENPYLGRIADQIADRADLRASMGGRFGSAAHSGAVARALAPYYGADWQQRQQRKIGAIGTYGNLQRTGTWDQANKGAIQPLRNIVGNLFGGGGQ